MFDRTSPGRDVSPEVLRDETGPCPAHGEQPVAGGVSWIDAALVRCFAVNLGCGCTLVDERTGVFRRIPGPPTASLLY
jgi:hypothetical protein